MAPLAFVLASLLLTQSLHTAQAATNATDDAADDAANATNATNATGQVLKKEHHVVNASQAAVDAAQAAHVANEVAERTVKVVYDTQHSLDKSRRAVHDARATTEGLSKRQKKLLKDAEAKLRDATRRAEYGKLQQAKYLKAIGHHRFTVEEESRLVKLEKTLSSTNFSRGSGSNESTAITEVEVRQFESDVEALRVAIREKKLREAKDAVKYVDEQGTEEGSDDRDLDDLEKDLTKLEGLMEAMKANKTTHTEFSRDEMKVEIEIIREKIRRMEAKETIPAEYGSLEVGLPVKVPEMPEKGSLMYDIPEKQVMAPLGIRELGGATPGKAKAWWRPPSASERLLPGGPHWDSLKKGYVERVYERKKVVAAKAP